VQVWRISKRKYAPAILSGDGGLRAAMRWNHKGHRIVYTSQSLSLATLELWVHTPPVEPLTSYVSVAAAIPEDLQITVFDQEALPPGWRGRSGACESAGPRHAMAGLKGLSRG
jgi:RES domain-containing protein